MFIQECEKFREQILGFWVDFEQNVEYICPAIAKSTGMSQNQLPRFN